MSEYFNVVMSSWCLSDFPVSGQITEFAISGTITVGVIGIGV
jgi:hypothetical protein